MVLGGASLFGGEGKLYKSVIGVFIMVVLANALTAARPLSADAGASSLSSSSFSIVARSSPASSG